MDALKPLEATLQQQMTTDSAETPGSRAAHVRNGVVVVYRHPESVHPPGHEFATHTALANQLAAIMEFEFAGEYDSARIYDAPLYFVPSDTLAAADAAERFGIQADHQLFGGVVPHPFVATKCITHALPHAAAAAPQGWSAQFGAQVIDVVLPGYSAFTVHDARIAAAELLKEGRVRLKKPSGIGGLGQSVIASMDDFEREIAECGEKELAQEGLVLERNLSSVVTHSVGQVCVGKMVATYCGMQSLTPNNRGADVYGGSRLTIVRGDFDALLRLSLTEEVRTAVAQARTYHAAAMASYPGMFASRCNYDVAQGVDDQGQWRSGVLEQSWRIGGASGAEIAALRAFAADPSLQTVCASTTEVYGDNPELPSDADIYYQGVDIRVGAITKYARLEPYANP
jgi:hypothetical protein